MKIGIELEVEEGEKAITVLNEARKFIADNHPDRVALLHAELDRAKYIAAGPDNHTGLEVENAKAVIDRHEQMSLDDLPF